MKALITDKSDDTNKEIFKSLMQMLGNSIVLFIFLTLALATLGHFDTPTWAKVMFILLWLRG